MPRAHAHPNTVARPSSPAPEAQRDPESDATSWEHDVTRPGDVNDLAALVSKTIPSVVAPLPEPPIVAPAVPAPEAPALVRVETDRTVMVRAPRPDRRRSMVAVAAASALAGLGAGYLLWGGSAEVATSVRGPAAPIPHREVSRAHAAQAPAPAPAPAPPAPAHCHASITDAPDGATVRWGDAALGTTPLGTVEVPCGAATVVLTHPRYEPLERAVTASAAETASVDGAMKRPIGTLELRSVPPGAKFTVDGAAVDPGAGDVKVRTFEQVTIVAQLPGYAKWTQRVYVHGPHDSVVAQLVGSGRRR
jgi:hypothetical protein